MAIATFTDLLAKLQAPSARLVMVRSTTAASSTGVNWISAWTIGTVPAAGTAPTTAAALSSATTGAITGLGALVAGRDYYLGSFEFMNPSSLRSSTLLLADRLSHQGGLDGTSIAAQTTNLPTAALTRFTTGVGVQAYLEIYTALGATATTFTCSYTNQAGTGTRTSTAAVIGGTAFNEVGRMIPIPLQAGDTGIRSVESVTLAASTLTVGNFGVTLIKPLAVMFFFSPTNLSSNGQIWFPMLGGGCNLIPIDPSACLTVSLTSTTTTIGAWYGFINLIENG